VPTSSSRAKSSRTLLRSLVLLTWAAVMAALVIRSLPPRAIPAPPSRPLPAEAREDWHSIYSGGAKIGYSHRVRTPTADGFVVRADASMEIRLMNEAQRVRTHIVAETDRALSLRHFAFRLRSGTIDFEISGTVREGTLELVSGTLGKQTLDLPSDAPMTLSETLQDFLGQQTLETGTTLRYSLFDPVSGAPATVSLTVGPLEQIILPSGPRSAHRVDQEFRGAHFRLWVEPDGSIVKEEGPLGFTLVREPDRSAALGGIDGGGGVDLAAAAAIPVARAIDSPRSTRRLRLRILEAPEQLPLSFPPRQRIEGSELLIERDELGAVRSFALPARETRFADDLRATPFLQIDDPGVLARSREILGAEHDAEHAARAFLDWVYQSLAKVPTISVPNAVQVLDQRKGDCNEHAVLYAALARAAGLPTRIASGVVYMPGDGDDPGAFYYHAWNEVWLGGWVAVDPTFGQFPADATHVKLAEGGLDHDVSLIGVIGHLRFGVEHSS
jgi:transglutaminase-like putative cysteine protease